MNHGKKPLWIQALTKFVWGVLLMGMCLFLPAGTVCYPRGWLLMGVLFVPMLAAGMVMLVRNPALLERRLKNRETRGKAQGVVVAIGVMFLAGFCVAGFTVRFQWHTVSDGAVAVATVVFLAGYALYGEVLRENAYLSRILEVQEQQKLIDTGVYALVRHPMYSATLLMFLSMPVLLGSWYAFCIFGVYPFLIAARIRQEEALLEQELAGYTAYQQRVPYRLIPWIW